MIQVMEDELINSLTIRFCLFTKNLSFTERITIAIIISVLDVILRQKNLVLFQKKEWYMFKTYVIMMETILLRPSCTP